jgi:Xaa-Pro dipeptidase
MLECTMSFLDKKQLDLLYRSHIDTLTRAYALALVESKYDAVVIHSGTPAKRSIFDDQFWPQRAVPHFQHWMPLITPRSALVIEAGKKPAFFHFDVVDFWEHAPVPESDHFWPCFDVKSISDPAKVKELRPTGKRVAFVGEDRSDAATWGFADSDVNPVELMKRIDALRVHKTPYEEACVREANRRACIGHTKVAKAFQDGDYSELQLHLLYLEATGLDDPETPYKNIVALGEHAATLHHVGYSRKPDGAQSCLLDAGARCLGYDSDITRTYVKGKGPAVEVFTALIAKMDRLQLTLCAEAKLGLPYERLHNRSHELLAPVLRDLGIAKGSDAELVEKGVTRKFLPHGLGHSLGLQTHDVGCRNTDPEARNPFLRNTTPISKGQIFTIEPGCYFIDSLLDELKASDQGKMVDWKLVSELRRFGGVRIEDDLAVTATGADNYTREFLPQ